MKKSRVKYDAKYIMLNHIINKIPSWYVRRFFYRTFGMQISNSSRIGINCVVIDPEKIIIGENSIINESCHMDGRGKLRIGNNVSISIYSKILTASHKVNSGQFEYISEATEIDDNVWLGCNAILLNGTKIKKNTIIGAGCVFKGVTEENGIYVGNPAKRIKTRELECEYTIHYEPYFR